MFPNFSFSLHEFLFFFIDSHVSLILSFPTAKRSAPESVAREDYGIMLVKEVR